MTLTEIVQLVQKVIPNMLTTHDATNAKSSKQADAVENLKLK